MHPHYGIDPSLQVHIFLLAGLVTMLISGAFVLNVAEHGWSIVRGKFATSVSFEAYQPATVIAR